MIDGEEQEILLNTLAETPQEEVHTIEEDIYVIGVESLNGQAGDLTLKSINGENLVGEGNIALQTPLNQAQLNAVNSGIDSAKVGQIATNATNITTLQNTKQDNLTQAQLNAANSGIDATKVAQIATNTGNITSVTNRVTTIEGKIPSAASSSNKLTDKNYVDNAIATNTANYISDNGQPFQSYDDLVAYSGPLTNNDYAFVETIDSAGNDIYTRYKYNADQNLWAEEYTITNPYFTSDQWASINSGIAANDVAQIGTNKTDIATLQTSKQDKLTTAQQAAVDSGIDATKVQQIATNATDIATLQTGKQDKLTAGTNIQINGTTISATDTTYTAGTGLTLTGTQFSVTEPVPSGFFTDTTASQTSEGTDLTINGTAEAPFKDVELKGDTFQQTYSGKNLFDRANAEENKALKWAEGDYFAETGSIAFGDFLPVTEGDAFSTNYFAQVLFYDANKNYLGALIGTPPQQLVKIAGNVYKSFTVLPGYNIAFMKLGYRRTNNPGVDLLTADIMVNSGDTLLPYEPYVGGVPSPNPDYPQDIQVVTGEQTIKVTGKNLCSSAIELGNINNTTGANESSTTVIRTTDYIQVLPDKTYTISQNAPNVVYEYAADKTFLGAKYVSSTAIAAGEYTFSTSSSTAYLRWKKNVGDTALRFQLELGSTATAYEPYQSQSYEVNLGKNLFDKSTATIGAFLQSDGSTNPNASWAYSDYIAINGGATYITSGSSTMGAGASRCYYDKSKTFISGVRHESVNPFKDTAPANAWYMRESIPSTSVDDVQIEAGSTPTSYAPYFTPIELCGIGKKPDGTYAYQNYIWKDGDTWKVHKAVGKVVLGGEEIWSTWSAGSQTNTLAFRAVGFPSNIMDTASTADPSYRLKSSHFTVYPQGTLYSTDMVGMATTSYNLYARILKSSLSTQDLTGFNNWLITNKPTVYYALATPADTAITNAELISQLDALWNATSYNPQTNIASTTPAPNLPAILTIDTFKNNWAGTLAGYQETINRLEARVEELEA